MVQALSDASALGELTVTVVDGRVTAVNGAVHELYAERYAADPGFARMLDSIRAPHRDTLQAVVATAAERVGRQYKSESPIDVLAADIMRQYAGADIAFLPGLGFGITWQPGPVTREMVVTFFPHPTTIVHERLSGRQVMSILEQSAVNLRPASDLDRVGGLIQTSGLRWTVNLTKPAGARVSNVRVGDRSLDEGASYTVVTNGGLFQGTHRQSTFAQGSDIRRDPRSFAAVIEEGLRRIGTVHAPGLGAITLVK